MKCHLVFLLVGWFVKLAQSHGHEGKHVHVKIVVPVYKHNHHHTHKVYKHLPPPPPQVVVHHHHHDHGHKHGHDHKHDHHHHKDHEGHEHWDVQDWSEHSSFSSSGGGDSDFQPHIPETVHPETESHKSLKVESFELNEAKDSSAFNPIQQHYVTGSYKVQQNDGVGTKSKVHKVFQAPLANINLRQTDYGREEEENYDEEGYEEPKQPDPYELEPLRQFFQNQNHI